MGGDIWVLEACWPASQCRETLFEEIKVPANIGKDTLSAPLSSIHMQTGEDTHVLEEKGEI